MHVVGFSCIFEKCVFYKGLEFVIKISEAKHNFLKGGRRKKPVVTLPAPLDISYTRERLYHFPIGSFEPKVMVISICYSLLWHGKPLSFPLFD